MSAHPGNWPDQIIPTKDKIDQWGKQIMDYAISRWIQTRSKPATYFQVMRNSYNGIISPQVQAKIDGLYGAPNRMPFADFRISRNKLDTILGEFLLRQMKATPVVANKEIRNKKQERRNMLLGMYVLRDTIEKAKEEGIDLTGGVKVPTSKEEAIAMSDYKSKAEIYFNRVTELLLKTTTLKTSFHDCLQELGLTSEAGFRTYINEYGKVAFEKISPEDAIFEEMKNDPFVQKTPYKGARLWMTKGQILKTFNLDAKEKESLDSWFNGTNQLQPQYYQTGTNGSETSMAVFHLEWTGLEAWPLKEEKHKKTGNPMLSRLSHEYYVSNKGRLEREEKNGKLKIDVKYKERLFEGFLIGDNLYKDIRPKKNTTESYNNPYHAPFTYHYLLFNTVGGLRVPFFALMEEAKWQYNWIRNAINREMSKFKGMVFGYNRALLPTSTDGKPLSMNYILWRMTNDGIIDYNSAAEGNYSGKDLQISDFFKATDLGVSTTMETLIRLAYDLERLVDRLSSVNDNRQGLTSASETVSNAKDNIMGSRTITEPMMFFFDRWMEQVMKGLLDCYRIRTLIDPEGAAEEIGEDGAAFFEDLDVSVCDVGVYMEDTRQMESIRQRIGKYMEVSINSGELGIPDAFEVDVAATVSEAKSILRNGWDKLQKLKQESQQADAQSKQAIQQQALDTQIAFREDEQQHEMEKIAAKGVAKAASDAQKARDKSVLNKTM